jgi:hypothetical protein
MLKFAQVRIEENLARMNAALATRSCPEIAKELVFNRVRVLKREGYAEDVAFSISLREHNFPA